MFTGAEENKREKHTHRERNTNKYKEMVQTTRLGKPKGNAVVLEKQCGEGVKVGEG